jgi:threonyl-tRNA synthetase
MRKQSKENELDKVRHSTAHLLAMAVLEKFPKTKLGIGPTVKNGFSYDFDFVKKNEQLKPDDLMTFEKRIRELIKKDLKFKKEFVSFAEAKKLFKGQTYKLDLLKGLNKSKKKISIYKTYEQTKNQKLKTKNYFVDLCAGPHVSSTKEINSDAFKLMSLAGAYWRGDEMQPMLTRIYGTAFGTKKELDEYLKMMEEAEKRDHKKLGLKMELFMFHETAPGIPYWLPKGLVILNELIGFWREEHDKRGYQEIQAPLLNKKELYEISGHWEHYRENMFISKTGENEIYALKPMNCPNAMVIFGSKSRSYRELPLRLSDTDRLHRYELSGTLSGLFRAREFSQDDAHIFISEDQVKDEYLRILDIAKRFYSIFKIDYSFRLGTRPKEFMGDIKTWNRAEKELKEILERTGKSYSVEPGDGAFYGPKIDILMKDSLGRDWQMGTIQLDFQIPKRFNLKYTDKNGKEKTPVVIHRVIYGSLERFLGILIEHFAGALPVWLAPVQVEIINVGSAHKNYAREIYSRLLENNIRASISDDNLTVSKRIREAEIQKIPYILVVGDKEKSAGTVSERGRSGKDYGQIKIENFILNIRKEIEEKVI